MPVYQFICEKHGGFEKITIKAEWGDIRCPKCGDKSKVDKKCKLAPESLLKKHLESISIRLRVERLFLK